VVGVDAVVDNELDVLMSPNVDPRLDFVAA